MPLDETPRQKKHASRPRSPPSSRSSSKRSPVMSSSILGCCIPSGVRPTQTICETESSRRHSRNTPWPTIPVAPNRTTLIPTRRLMVVHQVSRPPDESANPIAPIHPRITTASSLYEVGRFKVALQHAPTAWAGPLPGLKGPGERVQLLEAQHEGNFPRVEFRG